MKIEYSALFSLDLAKLSDGVDDLMQGINRHLSSMGVNERIHARSGQFQLFTVSVEGELTKEQITRMKKELTEGVNAVGSPLAKYGMECSEIRRKSGNVLQSVE